MSAKEFIKKNERLDLHKNKEVNLNKRNSIAFSHNNLNFGLPKKSQKEFYNSTSKFKQNSSELECNMKNFLTNYDELLENLESFTCLKKNSNIINNNLITNDSFNSKEQNKFNKSPQKKNLDHRKSVLLEPNLNFRDNILGLTQCKNTMQNIISLEPDFEVKDNFKQSKIIITPKTTKSKDSSSSK